MRIRFKLTVMFVLLCFATLFPHCSKVVIVGGKIDSSNLRDGRYEGQSKGEPVSVKVKVTIEDRQIRKIEILKHSNWKGKKTVPVIPERIIRAQSTKVEAVSGATMSSRVIMNAVHDAVIKAMDGTSASRPGESK